MGLLSSAINSALEGMGRGLMNSGAWMLEGGYRMWQKCCGVTFDYVTISPMSQTNAWSIVTGSVYSISLAAAASLTVLFFVIGWLRESIDIRNNFQLENMFRFFIRYAITVGLIVNSLSLITGIVECATAVVSTLNVYQDTDSVDGIFDDLKNNLEEEDADGMTWIGVGCVALIGGLIGGLTIIVCGISLVLSVLSRLFKMLLCIPLCAPAFSSFAGGRELSQTGISWLKTFIGYALEAIVIALAILISFGLFKDANILTSTHGTDAVAVILQICGYCMPMITACACVKGAEMTVRRCLGLG